MDTKTWSIYICCPQETHFTSKNTHRLKVVDGKGIPCKWKWKESQGSNIYIRQNDFKTKPVTRDKEGYYLMIKWSIQEENITI